ncbi:TetR/AcrR family transcriptional regulator C-terminal domain-containing protein [Microbacterium dextranolyticum]|uniref:TetR family transcriptional regulator n=1 Tax=Microbacterium dextranolyticum TaxID=36806 RepID=A0A9W6HMH1_9MICO|nr:TetR/AcrR family transcriptional regulator C-terminal domain-containing protein [Microbacterium dextranolyticum]MBM7464308.1 AcrR family transcriptional regulator [Microbacterium dextranolyticum]GLJ95305.1 TetR family transcriptional regulator [Microbacterium dextranolyticum]
MAKGITKERIVDAALAVLDDGGIEAVTLRAVAARLDVRAPALYWHVGSKQQLLDDMGTEIQRRVQLSLHAVPSDAAWTVVLDAYAHALRREYLAHRDGARTFSGTRLTDAQTLRAQEPWFERWVAQGLDLADAVDAAEIVTAYVVGFVIEEQERAQSAASDPERYSVDARDAAIGPDAPLVAAAGHVGGDADARFSRQLGIVIAGLAARFGV